MKQKIDKKWLITQIKPNSYSLAVRNLERQGFETFLPTMEITHRQENKFFVKDVHAFPGYLFVCFNPHIDTWRKINSTYGVSKILTFNKKPALISSELILGLKIKYERNNNNLIKKENLQRGDFIKFYSGPFAELIAKVDSVNEKNRIWILLEAMGGNRKLKLLNTENIMYNKV